MKKSLRQAIHLFPIHQRVLLYILLLKRKIGIKISATEERLLAKCSKLVSLIERGVQIQRLNDEKYELIIKVNEKKLKIRIREAGSDIKVFESVILNEEYKAAKNILVNNDKSTDLLILDVGANIGLTTLYFNAYLPNAAFVVVEPAKSNLTLLKENLLINDLHHVQIIENAIWINNEWLKIDNSFRDGENWSLSVQEAAHIDKCQRSEMVKGITLADLYRIKNMPIDLLKIDVEGAERYLFKDDEFISYIQKNVETIVIEIHDEFNVREFIMHRMSILGFDYKCDRDLTIFFKKKPS